MSNSRSLAKLPAFLSPAGVLSPQAGGTGVTSLNAAVGALGLTIGTDVQAYDADLGSIASLTGTAGLLKKTATNTWTLDTSTYLTGITSGQVITALGYTPYNSSNPSGYISGITSSNVTTALGFTPYNATNPNGYISGITSSNVTTALGYTPENSASKGSANGYASLDGSGLVPSSQLPSYVDDVLEYANLAGFPATGTTGKIYVALDTNKTYRWSGSAYIYITSGAVDSVAGKTGVVSLTSSDVGLGNVENKSSATIRSEISSANVTSALGFTPYNATNPSGYITGITSGNVTTALGFTPYNSTNPAGYITGITSSNVTTALGFTPYNSTNPAGYITGYTETDTLATVTARGGTTSGGITINSGTNDQGLTMTVSDGGWNYIGFSHGATRKAYFGLDGSGNPQWGSDSGAFTITGNYTTIGTSTRSPIFYDSDNTSYYIDPASNSVINSLAAYGNIETYHAIGAADDVRTGIVAYDTTAMGTNIGGQIVLGYKYTASGGYTQGAIIKTYKLNSADGDYSSGLKFQVRNTGEALATRVWIEPSGGLISDELMQSPIYYDYNSSGYYLDPASTSRLVSTIIGGHGGNAYDTVTSGRLYLGTNADNSYSIYTHLESVNGNYTKLTLDWHTGIKIGAAKLYGGTRFYNNSIASSGAQIFSVGDGDDNVRALYGFYTPITYDSNDTGYYIDPNGSTRLSNIFAGNVASSNDGGWNARFNLVGSAHARMDVVSNSDGIITTMYSHTGQGVGRVGTYSNHPLILMADGGQEGGRVYNGSLRAPIFYDLNNTDYYLDPAGTSVLNNLSGPALNDSQLWLRTKGDANHYLWNASDDWEEMVMYFGTGFRVTNSNGNGTLLYCYGSTNGNHVYTPTSFRAPIFYDSDNTSYYLNPASSSVLDSVTVNSITGYVNGLSGSGNNISGMGTASTWDARPQGIYDRYAINWHTGISLSGYPAYGGVRLYSAGYPTLNSSTLRLEASTGVYTYGQFTNDNRVDAPIFYDYNDTSYYVNPNSFSQLSYANLNASPGGRTLSLGSDETNRVYNDSARAGLVINATAYPHLYINATANISNPHHGAVFSMTGNLTGGGYRRWGMGIGNTDPDCFSWGYADNNPNPHYGVGGVFGYTGTDSKMWLNTAGSLWTTGDMRSQLFYDSNNTGYYVDPNSSSIMNTIRVAGTYARSSAGTGFLNGRYNEGAETTATTGPIYCINATSYAPGSGTSFGNMYGVGYTYASDGIYIPLSGATGWGAYVAIGGVPAIWLGGSSASNGVVSSIGAHYGSRFYTTGQSAYYCDPAGTTVLNALTVGGQPVTGGGGSTGSLNSGLGFNLL
jgi:hypothetical protein